MTKNPVLVAGAGSWGTALAIVLARNENPVYLWDIDTALIKNLQLEKENRKYLPNIKLPDLVDPVDSLHDCLTKIQDVVLAVPCSGLVAILKQLNSAKQKYHVCLACKGLAPGDQVLNHKVVSEYLPDNSGVAVISGPSFAREVANSVPTAVTIASSQHNVAVKFSDIFHNEVFRIYTHDDIIGAQVGGAVKNVMAIAAGISDGLGFGANTRSALITRGLAEIMRLGVAMGGKPETFMGLAGLGDLILTCTDDQSRNRRLGLLLATGISLDSSLQEIGQTVEGVNTADEVMKISGKLNIEMPITEQVWNVLNKTVTPIDAVRNLLARDPRPETE